MKNTKVKNEKGVTLLALVVTIIVMLILAGITIKFAFGDNSIINRTEEAITIKEGEGEREIINTVCLALVTAGDKINAENLQNILDKELGTGKVVVTDNGDGSYNILFTDSNNSYTVYGNGAIEDGEKTLPEATKVYATLYTDGTLGFSNDETLIAGKTAKYETWDVSNEFDYGELPWDSYVTEVESVVFTNKIVPNSMKCWFRNCSNLTSIQSMKENLDTSRVTNMEYLFSRCSKLQNIDVSKFNTSRVTNMSAMFEDCTQVQELDVSNFNTSNVTSMWSMFFRCSSLTELDVSRFNTKKVTRMDSMFSDCEKLKVLDVRSFNTENVTEMGAMFFDCKELTQLDLSGFNTSRVQRMGSMFADCEKITELDLRNFDTRNVSSMSSMFSDCLCLTELDLSSFYTPNLTTMFQMFFGCENLEQIDISNFETTKLINLRETFRETPKLTRIYANKQKWNIDDVENKDYLFTNCGTNVFTDKTTNETF